jgi:hypothetical protein
MIKEDKNKDFLVNFISLIFMLYIASTIIFRMKYIAITYILDAVLVGLFLLLIYMKKIKVYHLNKVLISYSIFAIFALFSSFWAKDFFISMLQSFQLFSIFINMYIIYNLIKNYNIENYFIYGVLIGSFINYVFALEIIPSFVDIYLLSRFTGTVGNPNPLSTVMIISIFVSIVYLTKDKEKSNVFLYYYQYINIILALYLIIMSVSRKGIVFGFALVLLQIMVSMKDVKSFFRLIIIGVIGFFIFANFANLDDLWALYDKVIYRFTVLNEGLAHTDSHAGSTGIRLYLAEIGLELFKNNPLIGVGVNNFRTYSPGGLYSHNNYVELLAGVGLIGTMAFYSIYIFIFQKIVQVKKSDVKFIFTFFLLVILGMDIASVSYYNKLILYTLLITYILLEKYIEENRS